MMKKLLALLFLTSSAMAQVQQLQPGGSIMGVAGGSPGIPQGLTQLPAALSLSTLSQLPPQGAGTIVGVPAGGGATTPSALTALPTGLTTAAGGNPVGDTDTQTITGKTMTGAANTFSAIPASAITFPSFVNVNAATNAASVQNQNAGTSATSQFALFNNNQSAAFYIGMGGVGNTSLIRGEAYLENNGTKNVGMTFLNDSIDAPWTFRGGPTAAANALFTMSGNQFQTLSSSSGAHLNNANEVLQLKAYSDVCPAQASTITSSSASITGSNYLFTALQPVTFSVTVGTGANGIVAGTTYFISATGLSSTTFQVSATSGGASITFNASGSPTVLGCKAAGTGTVQPNYAQLIVWPHAVTSFTGGGTAIGEWSIGNGNPPTYKDPYHNATTGGSEGLRIDALSNYTAAIPAGSNQYPFTMYPMDAGLTFVNNGTTMETAVMVFDGSLDTTVLAHPPALATNAGANGYSISFYENTGAGTGASGVYSTPAAQIYSTQTSTTGSVLSFTDTGLAYNGAFMPGSLVVGSPTSGNMGAGTINATGVYVNGVAVGSGGGGTGANPTASTGLTAVNGSATTFLRSDGSPALSQAIVPTWSGVHTFSAAPVLSAGATVVGNVGVTPATNGYGLSITGGSLTSGTTGFGVNVTGTVNDAVAVDGIVSFANIVCTLCTSTSYFADWQVSGVSKFKVDTAGNTTTPGSITSSQNLTAGPGFLIQFNTHGILSSAAAAQIQLGGANGASPVSQTLLTQGSVAGTSTNIAGGNLAIQSGVGTGSATGSTISLQTPHATTSGTTGQTMTTQLLIADGVITASAPVKLVTTTVAGLPTCSATYQNALAAVSDATTPTYGGALTGGGTVQTPVFCNGTAWSSH